MFISFKGISKELLIDFNLLKTNSKSQAYSISNDNSSIKNIINFDVDIIKIRPDTLFFSLSKGKTKLVPVKAIIQAECLPGYSIVSKPTLTPAYVTVTGDSVELSLLDTIYTQVLSLKNVRQNYKGAIALKKTSANINYQTKDVELNFEVDKLAETTVKVPIEIMNKETEQSIKLLPGYVTITYLVAMSDYDNIDANSFKAMVNYHQIKQNKKLLDVNLTVKPSEVKIIKIEPSNISYLIYK